MEEVDNIISHTLLQIGCDEVGDLKLGEFTSELLVNAISKCILLIDPNLDVPKRLPPGMAQRFTATASLAEACVSLGYRGDIGYQTFLYSNIAEVRKVFMFLIERLPKEAEKVIINEQLDEYTLLQNSIMVNIREQQSQPWMPQYCNKYALNKITQETSDPTKFYKGKYLYLPDTEISVCNDYLKSYWQNHSPNIFQQNSSKNMLSSLIHTNEINKSSRNIDIAKTINRMQKSATSKTISNIMSPEEKLVNSKGQPISNDPNNSIAEEVEIQNEIAPSKLNIQKPMTQVEKLNLEVERLKTSIDRLTLQQNLNDASFNDLKSQKENEEQILKGLALEKRKQEKINILLENPDESVEKIESIIATTTERIKTIKQQWNEHEKNLSEELETAKSSHMKEFEFIDLLKIQVLEATQKTQELKDDFLLKQKYHAHLVDEHGKMNKNINRQMYTSRILEIINNIKKQKLSIDKILVDTKQIQKEINNLNGQLSRQFTVTEELIYKTAKRNESSKKSYKLLVKLHSDCEEIIKLVQEIGVIMREIRDLDDQIEIFKSHNVSSNLVRISTDLLEMENDSKVLEAKIKQIKTGS